MKNTILYLLIFVLIAFTIFRECSPNYKPEQPTITVVHDTTYITKDSIVYAKPKLAKTIKDTIWRDSLKLVSFGDTAQCKQVYNAYVELGDKYFSRNVYEDSLKIDSLGYVNVKDTVVANKILGRSYTYNLKYPIVTNTITIKEPYVPKRQLYLGGGIAITPMFHSVEVGAIYKDRSDEMYGLKVGVDNNKQLFYGIQGYFKIRIKK